MREIGNPLYLPWCLEGMAGVASGREDWILAARIAGARDALQGSLGVQVPPADPAAHERTLARTREALGETAFTAAYGAGRAMPPADAIAACGPARDAPPLG
jgi:hypothetical protein